jgi:hypothetical protein
VPFTLVVFIKKSDTASDDLTLERMLVEKHLLVNMGYALDEDHPEVRSNASLNARTHSIFHVSAAHGSLVDELVASSGVGWELYLLWVGTLAAVRICNALADAEGPKLIMPHIVSGNANAAEDRRVVKEVEDALSQFIGKLNASQQQTVREIVADSAGNETVASAPALSLIWGPPGTLVRSANYISFTTLFSFLCRYRQDQHSSGSAEEPPGNRQTRSRHSTHQRGGVRTGSSHSGCMQNVLWVREG